MEEVERLELREDLQIRGDVSRGTWGIGTEETTEHTTARRSMGRAKMLLSLPASGMYTQCTRIVRQVGSG